jgi:hypothetical protein
MSLPDAEKTARIESAAAYRRHLHNIRYYDNTPTPEEVREKLKRRSRRTKRGWEEDRYHVKTKYDLDELNLTALRAPHVVREMETVKGARRRKTRKHHRTRRQWIGKRKF